MRNYERRSSYFFPFFSFSTIFHHLICNPPLQWVNKINCLENNFSVSYYYLHHKSCFILNCSDTFEGRECLLCCLKIKECSYSRELLSYSVDWVDYEYFHVILLLDYAAWLDLFTWLTHQVNMTVENSKINLNDRQQTQLNSINVNEMSKCLVFRCLKIFLWLISPCIKFTDKKYFTQKNLQAWLTCQKFCCADLKNHKFLSFFLWKRSWL